MMAFLRRWMGIDESVDEYKAKLDLAAAKNVLDQERGEYRQAITRVDAGARDLMRTWGNANNMLMDRSHDD